MKNCGKWLQIDYHIQFKSVIYEIVVKVLTVEPVHLLVRCQISSYLKLNVSTLYKIILHFVKNLI